MPPTFFNRFCSKWAKPLAFSMCIMKLDKVGITSVCATDAHRRIIPLDSVLRHDVVLGLECGSKPNLRAKAPVLVIKAEECKIRRALALKLGRLRVIPPR